MPIRDRLLAVFVAVLWGLNFIAIHATLGQFPPMFAGALRFLLIAVPTVFLVPRPRVKLRYLLGYGLGFGTGQFAFLFVAMHLGMPTGLASLVLQASAPFTVLLGAVLLRERVSGRQLAGILLAVAGMAAIAWQQSGQAALVPVLLTLLAALSWAIGNLSMRKAEPDNPLHLTLWMSVVPPLPMLALSGIFEGPSAGWHSLTTLGTKTGVIGLIGLAYVVIVGTVIGSGIWTTLMRRNPAGVVAPFSLLVPVVGLTASFFILGEVPTALTLIAAAVVIGGVLLGSLRKKPAVLEEELMPA
ncbi:EamA family transporter [Amycolatopsis benzoatilytica]|uniref:EamA family transporter n=1 Tax=Amycolatopsis benzoatilytica TaxID=346045 RepID=UPI00035C25B8|nr:EamA family transporter [Amycolatopsis benzoatilytica]